MNAAASCNRLRLAVRISFPTIAVALLLGALALVAPVASAAPSPTPPAPKASGSTSAQAAKKATFGIGPASAKRIDGRSSLEFLASPGAALTDHVAVVNLGLTPLRLNLYVVDATVGRDGAFGYLARSAARTDAAKWITPLTRGGRPFVVLGARQSKIIPLSIDVPANAPPGDHAAGVIASLTSHVTSSAGKDVKFEQRIALRAFIRVSGPLKPGLRIEALSAHYHGTLNPFGTGTVTVHYRVHNVGNVRLGARQTVTVSGLFGAKHPAQALARVPLLLPGTSIDVSAKIGGVLPQVRLTTSVRLYPMVVAGDVDPNVPGRLSASTKLWAVPWTVLIAVVVLALLVVLMLLRRRRRGRRGSVRPEPNKPAGPSGTESEAPTPAEPRSPGRHQHSGVQHMARNARLIVRTFAALALGVALLALGVGPARASSVPFADPNAVATLGFCDKSGNEITSGKIGDAPFAWTAVSSAPAPKGYPASRGRASLFVYQPIQYVDPGDWSGKQMTAGSLFSNTTHPMARATVLDPALVDFTSVFPPHWDGLVQFRMFFTAPDQAQLTGKYPAAVVRVKGDSWTLVSGGHPACRAGHAQSVETRNLPKSVFEKATPRSTPGVKPSAAASRSSRAAATRTSRPAAAAATTGSSQDRTSSEAPAKADDRSAKPDDSTAVRWTAGVAIAAVAAAAGLFIWWRRHRRPAV